MSEHPMIVAESVEKSYGRTLVLKGIDIVVPRGSVLCLLGRSGSGKSTFLRCINHLEKIQAGKLLVDSQLVGYRERRGKLYELTNRDAAAKRQEIGMVFQQFNLFPHMTVLGNIIEAPMRVRRESRSVATESARKLLKQVGLEEKISSYPSQLSGGQQQRVAIARAMAMEPKLMLFDEPTSALDPELVGEVLTAIRGLAATGMTMVIVTHEIQFAREVADSIAYMEDGKIVECGPPDQIFNSPQDERTQQFLSRSLMS